MGSAVDPFLQVSMVSGPECVVIHNISEKISTVSPHGVEGSQNLLVLTLPSAKKSKQQLQFQQV